MFTSRRITTMGGDKFRDEYSLAFDGTDDYIAIPSTTYNVHNTAYSFVFWAKRNAINSWDIVLGNSAVSTYNFIIFDTDGGDRLMIEGSNDDTATGVCSVVAGRWYHFAVITNGDGTTSMYQDGNAITMSDNSVGSAMVIDAIGAGSSNHFGGNISEIAIYNTALSASQVKTLYNGREPYNHKEGIATGNLTSWYRMGDGRLDGSAQITGNSDDSSQDNIISDEVDSSLGAELYTPANSLSTNEADDQSTGLTVISGATVADETSIVSGGASRSLKYTATGNTDGVTIDLTSDIDLTVGSVYKVSVDARHIGSGGLQSIRLAEDSGVSTTGETLEIIDISNSMTTFVTYTAYFIHSDSTTRYFGAREGAGTDDGGLYLDNLSVRQVNGNAGIMNNMTADDFTGDTP